MRILFACVNFFIVAIFGVVVLLVMVVGDDFGSRKAKKKGASLSSSRFCVVIRHYISFGFFKTSS